MLTADSPGITRGHPGPSRFIGVSLTVMVLLLESVSLPHIPPVVWEVTDAVYFPASTSFPYASFPSQTAETEVPVPGKIRPATEILEVAVPPPLLETFPVRLACSPAAKFMVILSELNEVTVEHIVACAGQQPLCSIVGVRVSWSPCAHPSGQRLRLQFASITLGQ